MRRSHAKVDAKAGGASEGPDLLAVADPVPTLCVKDFPSAARFTARQVAMSEADPMWGTYNRAERRRRARATRVHSDLHPREGIR